MTAVIGHWGTESTDTSSSPAAFPDEKLARARRRLESGAVSPNGTGGSYVVAGDSGLGDSYPEYKVARVPGEARYECSCYGHGQGDSRRRRICSHVKAVILWRKSPEGKRYEWRQRKIEAAKAAAQERKVGAAIPASEEGEVTLASSPSDPPTETTSLPPRIENGSAGRTPPLPADPSHPSWGPLPDWLTEWRPHQLDAIAEALDLYRAGHSVVFMEAPTGSGKTGIGIGTARQLGVSAAYLASTKTLQDQIDRDRWPGAKLLKGRSNYPTQTEDEGDHWGGEVTCADCTKQAGSDACRWCADVLACPYQVAKADAVAAPLSVLNYAYALTDWNLARGTFAGRGLVIEDEGDVLESELMGFVEVALSKRRLQDLGIGQPRLKGLPKGETVQPEWERWVREEALPAVQRELDRFGSDQRLEVRQIRAKKRLRELVRKLKQLADALPEGGWVYTDYERGNVAFKPVKVDRYGRDNLWRHGARHLVMSATLISADEMADSLGLEDHEWGLVTVPSTFDPANRPIRVAKVTDMGYKNRAEAWPKMAQAVSGVVRLHPDERVLVHAHTYDLAAMLKSKLMDDHPRRRIVSYTQPNMRQGALERYLQTPGAVLVAPSMDRGVDLPDEACRVQVVCKVPFGFMGDHQIKARLYSPGGRNWYTVQAIRTLVQATGRGVRHERDHCVSYILDSAFVDQLWNGNRRLFPKWWTEALDWRFDVRTLGVD